MYNNDKNKTGKVTAIKKGYAEITLSSKQSQTKTKNVSAPVKPKENKKG